MKASAASRPRRRSPRSCIKLGFAVTVEAGAGVTANFEDDAYARAGATIAADVRALYAASDIILKVRAPERHPALGVDEVDLLRRGQTLICFLWPAQHPDLLKRLADKGVTALAMDSVPAHLARPEDGRAQLDGQHRRVPRGRRGRGALRPLLHRADHRRRPDSAGQGARDWRGRRRALGHRHGAQPRRDRPRVRHAPRGQGTSREHGRRVPRCSTSRKRARASAATPR